MVFFFFLIDYLQYKQLPSWFVCVKPNIRMYPYIIVGVIFLLHSSQIEK